MITFIGGKQDGKYDHDLVFATKPFRKLSQRTPDSVFNLHYWFVEDMKLAEELGINTAGDVYMVKGTEKESEITHNGYNFES